MKCAFCNYEGPRPEMHAHLTDNHGEEVKTWATEGSGRRYFELACPDCDDSFRHQVKPRYRDPSFLEEYARELDRSAGTLKARLFKIRAGLRQCIKRQLALEEEIA